MNTDMQIKNSQSGQILLIVVLSMVVALSVGLSIASRTISNLNISKQNEESQRAFQAAEAGLERAVRQVYTGGDTANFDGGLANNSNFDVDIQSEPSNKFQLNGGDIVERAVGLDVWMSNYPDYTSPYSGKVKLFWGKTTHDCGRTGADYPPALEVLLIYGDDQNPQLLREVFDPCARISGTSSTTVTSGPQDHMGTTYQYSATFPSGASSMNQGLLFKVIPIFNSTQMGIEGLNGNLPAQGSVITSTGTSGDTVRKIQYFQSYPQIPNELFPYAIVSQNDGPIL